MVGVSNPPPWFMEDIESRTRHQVAIPRNQHRAGWINKHQPVTGDIQHDDPRRRRRISNLRPERDLMSPAQAKEIAHEVRHPPQTASAIGRATRPTSRSIATTSCWSRTCRLARINIRISHRDR